MAKEKKEIKFNIEEIFSKLTGKSRILFIAAAIFLALALMDRLMIGPFTSQMEYLKAEAKAQTESLRRSKRVVSFRDGIFQEYSKYSTYLDTGEMTQEQIISALLKKIETIAGQQSVTVTNTRPGDVEEKPNFRVYKTSIDCEGKLGNVLSFINLLEQSDYLFQVERYTMGPKSKGSDIVKCTFDIARILITSENVENIPGAGSQGAGSQDTVSQDAGSQNTGSQGIVSQGAGSQDTVSQGVSRQGAVSQGAESL